MQASPALGPYSLFVTIVTATAAAGYALMNLCRLRPPDLASRPAGVIAVTALVAWGALVVLPAVPWAPLVLGPLLWLSWVALRRLARVQIPHPTSVALPGSAAGESTSEGEPESVLGFDPGVPLRRLTPLVAVPISAIGTYAVLAVLAPTSTGTGPFSVGFVGAVAALSAVGTGVLSWALWQAVSAPEPARSHRQRG